MSRSGFLLLVVCVSPGAAQTPRSSLASFSSARALQGRAPASRANDEHTLVWELGPAADWEPAEGAVHPGGTVALEFTPVEHRLEVECGLTVLAVNGGIELPLDVLFKKPWRLSPQVEFMIGAGPELVRAFGPEHATFWGGEAVLDLMVWTRPNIGWYVEPGYEITFRAGTPHHGLALAAGLLIGR